MAKEQNDHQLTAEATLAVRREVEGILVKIAAVFGVANLAVLVGAIWVLWSTVTNQTAELSSSIRDEILSDIRENRAELNVAVSTANKLIGRLEQSQNAMDGIESSIGGLQEDITNLEDKETIARAAEFIQAWKASPEVNVAVKRIDSLLYAPGCTQVRVVSGRTVPGSTKWEPYGSATYGASTVIDTKFANFTQTPIYFASLSGDGGLWTTNGGSSIYTPKTDQFSIYVRWLSSEHTEPIVDYAKNANWHVNWLAIGC